MKMLLPVVAITAVLGLAVAPSVLAPTALAQATVGTEPSLVRLALNNFRPNGKLTVTSPAFKDGGDIPFENTQYRGNVFPGLSWTPGPADTKTYAIIMQDTDVNQNGTPLLHWTMFNIPATVTKLDPGMTMPPAGANFGPNVRGANQPYMGPRTPAGPKHHYHFQVLALGMTVSPTSTFDQAMFAIKDSVLAAGEIVGLGTVDPTAPPPAPRPAAAAPAAK